MVDYFEELVKNLNNTNHTFEIVSSEIVKYNESHSFDLFDFGVSDEVRYIYNNYKMFNLVWKNREIKMSGFVNFIPYESVLKEYQEMYTAVHKIEDSLIENQDIVINDIINWYPLFGFPNGDAFCYDRRNGKIVFYEHEVFDNGINLHGLLIAESIHDLYEKWSKVLFVDVYDWFEGVNERGIDMSKSVYKGVIHE